MNGLTLIVPSAATSTGGSASVSATGRVEWSGATTQVAVSDCFSSAFDLYRIIMWYEGTANTNLRFRFYNSGSSYTGSTYSYIGFSLDGTTSSEFSGGPITEGYIGDCGADGSGTDGIIYNPNVASRTLWHSMTNCSVNGNRITDWGCLETSSTQHTGFAIYPGSGSFTGYLTVYGIST